MRAVTCIHVLVNKGVVVAPCFAPPPHSKKVLASWVGFQQGELLVLSGFLGSELSYLPGLSVWSFHVLPVLTWVSFTQNPRY